MKPGDIVQYRNRKYFKKAEKLFIVLELFDDRDWCSIMGIYSKDGELYGVFDEMKNVLEKIHE
jgi:hypothetical protein